MTEEQRQLLRQSFEGFVPLPRRFGRLFYERLFELDPALRRLFKGDPDIQASMLADALTLAVLQLIDEGKVGESVRLIARRHVRYGVLDRHYRTFGEALLWTLEKRLGAAFTPEVAEVWEAAWKILARAMQDAARDQAADSD